MTEINQAIQMELLLIFLIWLALGATTAYLANQKGRDPFLWSMGILTMSIFGLPFAVMGLGLLYFLPSAEEEEEVSEKQEFEHISTEVTAIPVQEEPAPPASADVTQCQWYFYDQIQERHGPLSFQDFKIAWQTGHITADTFVWTEGLDAWKKTSDLPVLFAALKT